MHHSRLDLHAELHGAVEIVREHRGGKAELIVVALGERFFGVFHGNDARDRREALLIKDAHALVHVAEHRRAEERPFVRAAAEELCALRYGVLHLRADERAVALVDQRADEYVRVGRVANLE